MVVTVLKKTWIKSCKESVKGETVKIKMTESLADDVKVEDDSGGLRKTLK